MGVSAGRVTVDDGESMGISVQRTGKASDDDEDLIWDYGDQGGGGLLEEDLSEYQKAIEKIRIIEQAKQNLAHQRHSRLQARQEDSSLLSVASNGPIVSSTSITPTAVDSPTLSIVTPSGLDVSSTSAPTNIISDVPIGSTLQTLLSSTPPPSPAETSGMSIPSLTTTSSSESSTITTQPLSQNTGSTRPYTTITSYWTSQTLRNNGTTLSNTRTTSSSISSTYTASTTTIDGTVIVFTYPTNTADSSFSNTGNNSTRSSTSSVSSRSGYLNSTATSTISSDSLATSLWGSATDVVGGVGGGYVAPTSSNTVASPSSTSTDVSSVDNTPPVSPGLLGGVLGGVAGLAFVLVAILYLLRRHKRELAAQQRDEAGYGGPLSRGLEADQMTQRSGVAPFGFAGGFFTRGSPQSRVSQSSEAPTVPSTEVGFYKVSGRKLPPVLGGPRPGYGSTRSAGGSSLYPDDDGMTVASTPSVAGPSRYSSMTSASPTGSTAPMTFSTPSSTPISNSHPPHISSSMAAPPPRIQEEVTEESDTESTHKLPRPPPFPRQLSAISVGSVGKDGVGRSLPSHDGSRASRFTEDIV